MNNDLVCRGEFVQIGNNTVRPYDYLKPTTIKILWVGSNTRNPTVFQDRLHIKFRRKFFSFSFESLYIRKLDSNRETTTENNYFQSIEY